MGRAESVVYKYFAVDQSRQLAAELFAVFGLFFAVTGVLQQNYVAVFHRRNRCFRVGADNFVICREYNLFAQQFT